MGSFDTRDGILLDARDKSIAQLFSSKIGTGVEGEKSTQRRLEMEPPLCDHLRIQIPVRRPSVSVSSPAASPCPSKKFSEGETVPKQFRGIFYAYPYSPQG